MTTLQIHNPRARLPKEIEATGELVALRESRLGVLPNTKHNADVVLNGLAEKLGDRYGVVTVLTGKRSATERCKTEQIEEFAAACDWVITGSADCGSCTAWSIHTAVELEKRGVPAIVLVSDDFERLARYQARAMGFPQLRLMIVPHPLGGITTEKALEKVPAAFDIIAAMFDA